MRAGRLVVEYRLALQLVAGSSVEPEVEFFVGSHTIFGQILDVAPSLAILLHFEVVFSLGKYRLTGSRRS